MKKMTFFPPCRHHPGMNHDPNHRETHKINKWMNSNQKHNTEPRAGWHRHRRSPSDVSFHPELLRPFQNWSCGQRRGGKYQFIPLFFGDPAGTLECLPGRTTVFFPFLDTA